METEMRNKLRQELYVAVNENMTKIVNNESVVDICKKAIERLHFLWLGQEFRWFNGKFYEKILYRDLEFVMNDVMDCFNMGSGLFLRKSVMKSIMVKTKRVIIESVDNSIVCFNNGVLCFSEDHPHLKPFSPDIHVINMVPYDYDPKAKCPLWHKFLESSLPDMTLQMNLQEFLGLIFINRRKYKIETMMWLYGTGGNGKSVIFSTAMGLLGRENVTNFDLRDLCYGHREANIANINGKRLNYCSDLRGGVLYNDFVKQLVSGEPVPCREIYSRPMIAYNIPLMMGNCNYLPSIVDKTGAWARRIRIIPFDFSIPLEEQDKNLPWKLESEYAGIFNWVIEGRSRMIKNNFLFTPSTRCDILTNLYREEEVSPANFCKAENMSAFRLSLKDNGQLINSGRLYLLYRSWCGSLRIREEKIMARKAFTHALKVLGFKSVRKGEGYVIQTFILSEERDCPEKNIGTLVKQVLHKKDEDIEKINNDIVNSY